MLKYLRSAITASGDTVKTIIDTLTIPAGAKGIVGCIPEGHLAATITSGEVISGKLELESDDVNLQPCQLPIPSISVLTSGTTSLAPYMYPLTVPVKGGERVKGYITMDMAQTGALKAAFTLVVEA